MTDALTSSFVADRQQLWSVAYRLTGDASEADDIVQDAFEKAVTHRPSSDEPLRLWLTRVVTNAGIDRLRRRKAAPWAGPWLPTPVETEGSAEQRYDQLESATIAYLYALEALTPVQRAVLILREVAELSVAETASILNVSESNVKVTLHRARAALDEAALARVLPTREERARHQRAVEQFISLIMCGDLDGLERMMAEDVRAIADGGGRYAASTTPIDGPARVARLYLKLAQRPLDQRVEVHIVNGLPALVARFVDPPGKNSPLGVIQLALGPDGRIARVFSMVVPEKLSHVRFPEM